MINQNLSAGRVKEIPEYVTADLSESLVASLGGTALGEGNVVAVFLARYVHTDSDRDDPLLESALDVLCRKLSVQRIVRTSYDSEWRMAVDSSPLDKEWWPLLLFMLLAGGNSTSLSGDDQLGFALKRINAALVGIDVAEGLGLNETALSKLAQFAESRLDELAG
jgi:hypothetical protein